ncbi:MAG: hypothetical protein GKR94_15535 [Gammaproteobacteria bacterium]|nr:hypothetical protein [Gammaproteobacteria bacterium]
MGLAVVHGVIHKLNGHIHIESVEGQGTCVNLLLPRKPARSQQR